MKFAEKLHLLLKETKHRRERTAKLRGRFYWSSVDARLPLKGKTQRGSNEQTFASLQGTGEILDTVLFILQSVLEADPPHAIKKTMRQDLQNFRGYIDRNRDVMEHPDTYRHQYSEFGIWVCAARARVGEHYYKRLFLLAWK